MFRFLPLTFIFFSFGLFLLVVSFLTTDLGVLDKKKLDKALTNIELLEKNKNLDLSLTEVQKKKIIKTQPDIEEINKKKIKDKNKVEVTKKVFFHVQFGAFSSLNKAEFAKNELTQILKKNNLSLPLYINFIENKDIYQLMHKANTLKDAKKICKLSKDMKVDCYVKKL